MPPIWLTSELGFGTQRPVAADQAWTKRRIGSQSAQLGALAAYRLPSR